MDLPHPALSAAILLLLGGAGLIVSKERRADARGATPWLGCASVVIALAVWVISVRSAPGVEAGDSLFLSSADSFSLAGVPLLFLGALTFLAVPVRAEGRRSDVQAGFLLIATAAGVVFLSASSVWLLFLMAEVAWVAARLAAPVSGDGGAAPRIEWRIAVARACLLAAGLGLIAFAAGRHDLNSLQAMLEWAVAFPDHDLLGAHRPVMLQAGLTLVIVSLAWRMRMFPFAARGEPGERSAPPRLIAALAAGVLAPRLGLALRGFEDWSAVLLCAFGIPTVLVRIARGTRPGDLRTAFDELLTASLGLVWLSTLILLYDARHGLELAPHWGSGRHAPAIELAAAVCSWLLVNAALDLSTAAGRPLVRAGDLSGWLRGAPLVALLFLVGLLNWGGFPGTMGGAGRAGMLSGLAQLGSSTLRSADGFMLLALLVLYAQFRLLVMGVRLSGLVCGGRTYGRSREGVSPVAWLTLGALATAIFWVGTTGRIDWPVDTGVTNATTATGRGETGAERGTIGADSDRWKARDSFYR